MLPLPLAPLCAYDQFLNWEIMNVKGVETKVPVNEHGYPVDAHDPKNHKKYSDIRKENISFALTEKDPFFFLDIDHCLNPDGKTWSALAMEILSMLPGAAVEVSQSGTGLHIIGKGVCPKHSCKNTKLDIELYTEKRTISLTGINAIGSAGTDLSVYLPAVVDRFFPPRDFTHEDWGDQPVPEWNGPADDNDLILKACETTNAASVFGAGCNFLQLWSCDEDALSKAYPDGLRTYDESSADAALAQHLAFWTGKNPQRIYDLMLQSALKRDKWERDDYLRRTVMFAVSVQKTVYTAGGSNNTIADTYGAPKIKASSEAQRVYAENIRAKVLATCTKEQAEVLARQERAKFWLDNQGETVEDLIQKVTPITQLTGPVEKPHLVSGFQYLSCDLQMEYFRNCVYVQDMHRVLTGNGTLLKQEQFNATYGGYTFQMDDIGDKTTKKAWEAFTESQAVRYPIAQSMCFRPDLPSGELMAEEGQVLVNAYVPIKTKREQGDPERFLSHLKKILPVKRDREIVLSYMAACVQHKGVKFQWAPLLQGVEGNGKTLLTRCVAFAVGRRYTHYPKAMDVDNKFNGWLLNKLFIGIEDIYVPDNKREVIETLKPMITGGDGLEIQLKGVDQVTVDICANFMLNSNHKDAIRKTKDDRRFCVLYTAQQNADDIRRDGMTGAYFPKLYKWLREGGYAVVNELLHTYAIPDELNPATSCHRAPETSSTQEAIIASSGSIEQEILEAIDEGRMGFAGGWVSSVALERLLQNMRMSRAIPHNKRRDLLRQLGYDWHPALNSGRVNNPIAIDDGKKPRLFIKNGHIAANIEKPPLVAEAYQNAQRPEEAAATTAGQVFA